MGFTPIDAGIGDALSIDQRLTWHEFLCPGNQIALDHDPQDVTVSRGNLRGDIAAHETLTSVVLIAVGMAAVDHDARREAGFLHLLRGLRHCGSVVIRRLTPTPQDEMTVRITPCKQNRRLPRFRVPKESMGI